MGASSSAPSSAHQTKYVAVSLEEKKSTLSLPKKNEGIEEAEPLSLTFRQILSVLAPFLAMVSVGMTVGFTGVALPQLQREDSPIKVNQAQASWIAGMSVLSTLVGSLTSGFIMDRIGRKATFILVCCPFVIGWVMITMAQNLMLIYAGRLIAGVGIGGVGAPNQVYIAEVTRPSLRGALGGTTVTGVSLGVLLVHVLGTLHGWRIVAGICAAVPLSAGIVMLFFPETPNWLASRGEMEKAKISLKRLRGNHEDIINVEYEALQKMTREKNSSKDVSTITNIRSSLFSSVLWLPLRVMLILFFIQQFSAYNVLIFYSADLLRSLSDYGSSDDKTGEDTDSTGYVATVAMSILRLIICIIAPFLLRRFNRRTLQLWSGGATSAALLLLAGYSYCVQREWILHYLWIPFMLMAVYLVAVSAGVMHMPWVMVGEIFPLSVRGIGTSLAISAQFVFMFILIKTYPAINESMGRDWLFVFYAVLTILGTLGVYFWMPETRGRTLQDIEKLFIKYRKPEVTQKA